jgi:hypothetical protein
MRWLINYFRSVFCKHKWKLDEAEYDHDGAFRRKVSIKVSATCI